MSLDNMTELRKRIPGGKYALARAIAERAKQLQNGALPLTEVKVPNHITVAIDEVIQGKVNFDFKTAEDIEAEVIQAEKDADAAAKKALAQADADAAALAAENAAAAENTEDETATEAA